MLAVGSSSMISTGATLDAVSLGGSETRDAVAVGDSGSRTVGSSTITCAGIDSGACNDAL